MQFLKRLWLCSISRSIRHSPTVHRCYPSFHATSHFTQSLADYNSRTLAMFWGRLSDHVGRKPVMLIGLMGMAISVISFGLQKTYVGLIIARFVAGMMNGTQWCDLMAFDHKTKWLLCLLRKYRNFTGIGSWSRLLVTQISHHHWCKLHRLFQSIVAEITDPTNYAEWVTDGMRSLITFSFG